MTMMYCQLRKLTNVLSTGLIFCILLSGFQAQAQQVSNIVYLYTYHNKPPFIVNKEKEVGLYYDLAEYLSERDKERTYVTVYLPRKRLDRMIDTGYLDGAVIGVSPVWFNDVNQTRFLWLGPLYEDRDEFVSLSATPFEFRGPDSLVGKIVAGVAGYYYFGINEAVNRRVLDRIDTIGERQVLELIAKKRADFGIVSQSVFTYLKSVGELNEAYHFSEQPHDVFLRQTFTLKTAPEIHSALQPLLENLLQDKQWRLIAERYE